MALQTIRLSDVEPKKFKRCSYSRTNRRLGLYMSNEEFDKIKEIAETAGTSMNKYIMDAIWKKHAHACPSVDTEKMEQLLQKHGSSLDDLVKHNIISKEEQNSITAKNGWISQQTFDAICDAVSDDIQNAIVYTSNGLPIYDSQPTVKEQPRKNSYVLSIVFEADETCYNDILPYALGLKDLSKNYGEMRANRQKDGTCRIEYDVAKRNQTANQLAEKIANILMDHRIYTQTVSILEIT